MDDLAEEFQQITSDEQEAKNVAETVTDVAAKITDYTIDATVEALLKEQIEAEKKSGNAQSLPERIGSRQTDYPVYRRTRPLPPRLRRRYVGSHQTCL